MKEGINKIIGLPIEISILIFSIVIILSLSPYLAGLDFGILKIPLFSPNVRKRLMWIGPLLFILLLSLHIPIIDYGPDAEFNLSGTYQTKSVINDTAYLNATLTINQSSNTIKGEMLSDNYINNVFSHRIEYSISGKTYNGFILLTAESNNKQNLGLATGIFKVFESGNKLIGSSVGINNFNTDIINDQKVIWTKKN